MSAAEPAAPGQGRRALLAASAVGVLVAGATLGHLVQGGGDSAAVQRTGAGALPPVDVADPGLVHVHGLGVDPADGTLYAATHSGLFEVPDEGGARRIADRYQDTMGFTVAGPGVFLGSGHPDPREDDVRPPLLGLIRSTDRGQSWERLSLHGEADFHALEAAHGRVYGYDSTSGTFMVSEDQQRWDRRGQVPMRDFAVDPADPDTVLATTEQGTARSTDGGRTFSVVQSAPALVVLAWPAASALYGIDVDGVLHHSADAGATWTARGSTGGAPEAITASAEQGNDVVYAAVRDRGILRSDDGGSTFVTLHAT